MIVKLQTDKIAEPLRKRLDDIDSLEHQYQRLKIKNPNLENCFEALRTLSNQSLSEKELVNQVTNIAIRLPIERNSSTKSSSTESHKLKPIFDGLHKIYLETIRPFISLEQALYTLFQEAYCYVKDKHNKSYTDMGAIDNDPSPSRTYFFQNRCDLLKNFVLNYINSKYQNPNPVLSEVFQWLNEFMSFEIHTPHSIKLAQEIETQDAAKQRFHDLLKRKYKISDQDLTEAYQSEKGFQTVAEAMSNLLNIEPDQVIKHIMLLESVVYRARARALGMNPEALPNFKDLRSFQDSKMLFKGHDSHKASTNAMIEAYRIERMDYHDKLEHIQDKNSSFHNFLNEHPLLKIKLSQSEDIDNPNPNGNNYYRGIADRLKVIVANQDYTGLDQISREIAAIAKLQEIVGTRAKTVVPMQSLVDYAYVFSKLL